MFSIYGMSGPIFQGPLETLPGVPGVSRRGPAPAVEPVGGEAWTETPFAVTGETPFAKPAQQAIGTYRDMLAVDQERGPLYHSYQIMQREVIAIMADDDVERAWRVLLEHHIRHAPVLDAKRQVVGVINERDLLLTALNVHRGLEREVLAKKVSDVMTTPVVCADPVTDIRRIAELMLERDIDGVPIVDETHALVGFIARSDLLRAMVTDPPLSLWR